VEAPASEGSEASGSPAPIAPASPRRPGHRPQPPVPAPTAAPPESPAREPATVASDSPAPAPALPSAPSAPPDLSFRALSPQAQARFAEAGPDAVIASRPGHPGRRGADELRAEIERAEEAVANVREGRADPLLYDYMRSASARFQKDAETLAKNIPLGPGATVQGWGRGYLKQIDDAHRGLVGDRRDAPREAGGDAPNEPSPHADVLSAYQEAHRLAAGGAEERHAEVCLEVAPGREPTARLRRGSGSAALDRLALESFSKAAAARPVPPGTPAGLACYELRISAYRFPPVPMFGCSFDLTDLRKASCAWPFKKITSVKSRLLSVEYPPGSGGTSATRSLLRRPR